MKKNINDLLKLSFYAVGTIGLITSSHYAFGRTEKLFDYSALMSSTYGGPLPGTEVALPGYNPMPWLGGSWQIMYTINPPAPHPYYKNTYAWQQNNGYAGMFVRTPDAPLNATEDPNALMLTMDYFHSAGLHMDYVFSDIEVASNAGAKVTTEELVFANIKAIVDQVRVYPDAQINTAKNGAYPHYPGKVNMSGNYFGFIDHTRYDTFYDTSGLNVAMPDAYPYAPYISHSDPVIWGGGSVNNFGNWWDARYVIDTNLLTPNQQAAIGKPSYMSPNQRAALFYAPLERVSTAKRNLPAGHELIPWVTDFQPVVEPAYNITPGQAPTIEDNQASVEHYRLRGADGFYAFWDGGQEGTSGVTRVDNTTYRTKVHDAWHSLDWFFSLPTTIGSITANTTLNLDTNKNIGGTYVDPNGLNGGIEWSAYQRGNRIITLVSNLGNGDQSALWSLPSINSNLPAKSPIVPIRSHDQFQYLSNPTYDKFESIPGIRTLNGPQKSRYTQTASTISGLGNLSTQALATTSKASSSTTQKMWFVAENPGGLLMTDQMLYGGKLYFNGSINNGVTLASFEPVNITSSELAATNSAVATNHEGPILSMVGSSTSTIKVQFRATGSSGDKYQATNFSPVKNRWYEFSIHVDPYTNAGSAWYKDLYAINVSHTTSDSWIELKFDNLATTGVIESLTTLPLLLSTSATTTLFNGWQITGVRNAQFDDLSIQFNP